ncbi:MAG: EI24 domain-containing protein [Burkholderiales bacterium]|jgi:hypothetical protein|nr:EI24 domain-containing protein [Burkholderiales bacterium]
MNDVLKSLGRALASLGAPGILWLMLWPLLVAVVGWGVVAYFFAPGLVAAMEAWAASGSLPRWIPAAAITGFVGWLLVAVTYLALVVVTTGIVLGAFSMPFVVSHVARQDYPGLERKRGGTLLGSVTNGLAAFAIFAGLALLTLPLWVFPVLWPLLLVGLFAVLNTRVFRYDALSEHASAAEMQVLAAHNRAGFYALGAITAALGLVPIAGFFSPVVGGLAFTQYGLRRLAALRGHAERA